MTQEQKDELDHQLYAAAAAWYMAHVDQYSESAKLLEAFQIVHIKVAQALDL